MDCPYCDAESTRVVDTRETSQNEIRRRRECDSCGGRFTTYERVESPALTVIKSDGEEEAFDRAKVLEGIERACNKRPVDQEQMEDIADQVESEIRSSGRTEIEADEIGEMVAEKLRDIDEVAYVRFASVYRSFEDVESFKEELEDLEA